MENNEVKKSVTKVSKNELEVQMKLQDFEDEIRRIKSSPSVQISAEALREFSSQKH